MAWTWKLHEIIHRFVFYDGKARATASAVQETLLSTQAVTFIITIVVWLPLARLEFVLWISSRLTLSPPVSLIVLPVDINALRQVVYYQGITLGVERGLLGCPALILFFFLIGWLTVECQFYDTSNLPFSWVGRVLGLPSGQWKISGSLMGDLWQDCF